MIETYYEQILKVLEQIRDTQADKICVASRMVADTIKANGIIYVFGCGHSHLIGLDCFYRAGGLANVSAMLDTDLMLHNGAAKSSVMEKMPYPWKWHRPRRQKASKILPWYLRLTLQTKKTRQCFGNVLICT